MKTGVIVQDFNGRRFVYLGLAHAYDMADRNVYHMLAPVDSKDKMESEVLIVTDDNFNKCIATGSGVHKWFTEAT